MKPALPGATRILQALLVALVLTQGPAPKASADNRVSISIAGGERTAFISSVEYAPARVDRGVAYQIGTAIVVVDDLSGRNAGWIVALHVDNLPASQQVAIASIAPPTWISGQTITTEGGPNLPGITPIGAIGEPRIVMLAEPGFGKGRYEQRITVVHTSPADSAAASGGQLTVTITPRRSAQ